MLLQLVISRTKYAISTHKPEPVPPVKVPTIKILLPYHQF